MWCEGGSFTSAAARCVCADQQKPVVAIPGSNGALATINGYDEYGIPSTTNQGYWQYKGRACPREVGTHHCNVIERRDKEFTELMTEDQTNDLQHPFLRIFYAYLKYKSGPPYECNHYGECHSAFKYLHNY